MGDQANQLGRVYEPDLLAQYDTLLRGRREFPAVLPRNREYYYQLFERFGREMVYEIVSTGTLPMALALDRNWPVSYFLDWWEEVLPPSETKKAMKRCATAQALKASLVLTPAMKKDQYQQAKALSERMTWLAERIAPEDWGPRQKPEAVAPVFNVVFQGMPDPLKMVPAEVVEEARRLKSVEKKQVDQQVMYHKTEGG